MNTGSVLARFTITLSKAVTEPVQVEWYTSDGTAKAGVDYATNKGVALFAPGETAKTVDILVYGRTVGAEDRSFFVEMLPPTNAILGASVGECIITVDTSGSTPVTQIIVPTGPVGPTGKSAYQSWLDQGNTGTEQDFINSYYPDPDKIAEDVAPLIDVGATTLTAQGTETLGTPDATTVKAVARRVAYAGGAKIATVTLAAGDNLLSTTDLTGDAVDFMASGFIPKILHGGALTEPLWEVDTTGKLLIKGASAGDTLYAVQYDFISSRNRLARLNELNQAIDRVVGDLASADDGKGDATIAVKQSFTGSIPRTQHDKNAENVTIKDANAKGDGATDDTAAFSTFESSFTGRDIDLRGLTYLVSSIPAGNRYFNGKFKVGATVYDANRVLARDNNGVLSLGDRAASSIPPDYVMPPTAWGRTANGVATIAFGQGALAKATKAKQTTAIGPDAMGNTLISFDNNAWGECALQNVQSESDEYGFSLPGTRNIGIGGNAGQFLTTGDQNIFIGRNNGCCSVTVSGTTSVGANALGGQGYGGWYRDEIINFLPNYNTNTEISVFGNKVGQYFTGTTLTAVGFLAGANLKTGDSNVLMGNGAGRDLESDVGWQGKVLTTYDPTNYVTYVKTGENVVVTAPGSGAVVGGKAHIYWSSGPASPGHGHPFPVDVTAVSGDTFTIQCPLDGDGTGNARLHWTTSTVDAPKSRHNFMAGCNAGMSTKTATNSVLLGSLVGQFMPTVTTTVAIGYGALQNNTSPNMNSAVVIGTNAMRDNTGNCGAATAVGHNAGLLMQDGSVPTISVAGSTMLGSNSRVSGANQVQLGGSGTTPYAYAALQIRSDKRDKADEREIDGDLAVAFVRGLKSYFYKLDLRDDYIETYEVQVGIDKDAQPVFETRSRTLPKDGSKKRVRDHAGYFTQQVKALMDELGIDFGMYQDHLVNGGCDVQSLGYEQAIPFVTKALDVAFARMDEIETRLAKLEAK